MGVFDQLSNQKKERKPSSGVFSRVKKENYEELKTDTKKLAKDTVNNLPQVQTGKNLFNTLKEISNQYQQSPGKARMKLQEIERSYTPKQNDEPLIKGTSLRAATPEDKGILFSDIISGKVDIPDNISGEDRKYLIKKKNEALPGRNIPVVGDVLKGLDRFSETPLQNTIADVGETFYTPGAGLTNVAGAYNAVGAGINKVAPKLSNSLKGRVVQEAIKEGVTSAPLAAGQTLASGETDLGEVAKQGVIGGVLGAGTGAVLPLIGATARGVFNKLSSKTHDTKTDSTPQAVQPMIQEKTLQENNATNKNVLNVKTAPQQTEDILKSTGPRVRDKVYTYLDEAEKAARERLKGKRNTLSSNPVDQYADHAIILASQIGKGGIKLVDATEYLVKEFGEEIRPYAQQIYNRAKRVVQETERRASKEAQEARIFNSVDQGDATSFRGKVNRKKNLKKTPFKERWEKLRTQFIDDLAPLEGVEKRVRGKVASAEDSLYKSGRLFRGVPEKADRIVKDRLAPIINGIESKGYTSSDLGDYALAVHAKDVNAKDIKSGFTNKEIDEVINRLGTPEMEVARKKLIQISDNMLKELENTGVISGDLVRSLKEKHPNYMPLFRNFDDEKVEFASGLGKSLVNVTSPIKGLKGSSKQVIDPLESMVKNIFQSTNAAERNKVAAQIAKLAKDDVDSNFIRKLNDGEEVGRKNVVSVLEGGEKVKYEVEPEVYKALLNLDKETSNILIKILQKPASLLRAGATLTPEFSLRNPLRDVLQAFVTSESGFNPLIDFPVGLIQAISKGDLYKQWADELGAYGNIISNDRQVHKEALNKVLTRSAGKKIVNIINPKSWVGFLRAIADASESATKVGEFRAALRKGTTPQEAAYRSRDVMDFGRAGNSVRQTNRIVAFLNANIQGKSKLLRAFKADPAGFSARAFSAVTVPTIGIFLMQKYMANDIQKQIIDESPSWMTDTFWLIPIPGTDHVGRIPKPFDLSILFSNLPERALNFTFDNDKEAFDGFAKKAMSDMALPGMISGLTPFIEGMANYSFFQQRNIIPMGEEYRNFEDQYNINTTETAKLLASGAQKITGGEGMFRNFSSPRIMDNTIRGLTAGLGTYATSAIDVLLNEMNLTNNPVKPEKGVAQKPLAKAFLVNPLQGGKSTEQIYDMRDKLTREKGSAKINDTEFKDKAKLDFINIKTREMADINKIIRDIENSEKINASKKREAIEKLLAEKNRIARDAIKTLKGS